MEGRPGQPSRDQIGAGDDSSTRQSEWTCTQKRFLQNGKSLNIWQRNVILNVKISHEIGFNRS